MKETRFIAQNKEKWQESEQLLKESDKDPEKLSNLFTQVIDDLSFSRTYYPNRSVRVYLNRIAREYFSIIYRNQPGTKHTIRNFWVDELPQIVYQSRRPLLISLIVFVMACGIGVFSSLKDPDFAAVILGDDYVNMTKANIEKGDPMAVYKEAHQVEMFLGITLNNLMVAFRTYVFGVFFSIGTLAILIGNGVMVGCFQFFFVQHDLLAESALTIWLHGTLEISSIVLAGGAGLTLGSGLLFPGTYSRLQAFQLSAIRSLKLMLGISPIFVLAALIESFITRYTEVPDAVRLGLILVSAFFIVGYFVVYPWAKARKGFDRPLEETKLAPSAAEPISFTRIKNNGEIIKDTFSFYRMHWSKLFRWILVVTAVTALAELLLQEERLFNVYAVLDPWSYFFDSLYYALKTPYLIYVLVNAIAYTLICHRVFTLLVSDMKGEKVAHSLVLPIVQCLVCAALFFGIIFWLGAWGSLLMMLVWSFVFMVMFAGYTDNAPIHVAVSRMRRLASQSVSQMFGLQFVLTLLSFAFLIVFAAPLVYTNLNVIAWNVGTDDPTAAYIIRYIEVFIKLLGFNLMVPVFGAGIGYLFCSLREIETANDLMRSVNELRDRHQRGRG